MLPQTQFISCTCSAWRWHCHNKQPRHPLGLPNRIGPGPHGTSPPSLISRHAPFTPYNASIHAFFLFFFFFLNNSSCFFLFFIFYLWLCWVFVSVRGLSPVAASGGHSSSRCGGLSLSRPLSLRSTGSRRAGSVVVAHGSSCSAACGIFPDQGSNPCPLHWQADSQPLRHQGSPLPSFLYLLYSLPP